MATDLLGSPLSLAILGLISLQPMSGYDLRKCFATTPMGHFSASPGAVYPALARLEKAGWIRGTEDLRQALRPRRMFALTKKGEDILVAHLSRAITREDVIWRLDELLLRFSFMGHWVRPAQVRRFLKEFRQEIGGYLEVLQAQRSAFPDLPSPTARLALDYGLAQYQAALRWADQALVQLKSNSGASS